jgi:hypothetical protein
MRRRVDDEPKLDDFDSVFEVGGEWGLPHGGRWSRPDGGGGELVCRVHGLPVSWH